MSCTSRTYSLTAILGIAGMLALFMATATASASPVTDIKDGLNDALFGGDNLYAAGTLLTAAVMVSVGLVLGMMRLPSAGIFIVLFCVLGALTAIGWADVTFILVAGLIAVALFGKTAVNYVSGGGGPESPVE